MAATYGTVVDMACIWLRLLVGPWLIFVNLWSSSWRDGWRCCGPNGLGTLARSPGCLVDLQLQGPGSLTWFVLPRPP